MLLYFITCISFVLFLKSLVPLKQLSPWAIEMRLICLLFCKELFSFKSISKLFSDRLWLGFLCRRMSLVKKNLTSEVENVENKEVRDIHVLDLPELVLECILERLPPPALCRMAGVCRSLRERCVSDHLWERHMKQKWGRVIGAAARREWQWHVASKRDAASLKQGKQRGFMRLLSLPLAWPFSWIRSKVEAGNSIKQRSSLPPDSVMGWYLALETGSFCFPAQVYNREVSMIYFMLCR